jgi:hypothetical protein
MSDLSTDTTLQETDSCSQSVKIESYGVLDEIAAENHQTAQERFLPRAVYELRSESWHRLTEELQRDLTELLRHYFCGCRALLSAVFAAA